jgi:hypothetical protein
VHPLRRPSRAHPYRVIETGGSPRFAARPPATILGPRQGRQKDQRAARGPAAMPLLATTFRWWSHAPIMISIQQASACFPLFIASVGLGVSVRNRALPGPQGRRVIRAVHEWMLTRGTAFQAVANHGQDARATKARRYIQT